MNNIRKITRKTLLNEVAGISFIVRKWADILEKEVNQQMEAHRKTEMEKIQNQPKKEEPKHSQSSFNFPEKETDDKKNDPFYWEDESGYGSGSKYKNDDDYFSSWKKNKNKDWKEREGGYYKKRFKSDDDYGYTKSSYGRSYGSYGSYTPRPSIPPLEEIVVMGEKYPEEYKQFSVDKWVMKSSNRIEYDHRHSGYDEEGKYVVYFNIPIASMSKGAFIHEIKHAYDDWNRMSHGGKPIRDSWEIKNIYTPDFEKLVLGGSSRYPQLGSLIRNFYLGSSLETPAYLENEYDGAGVGYQEIGRKLKNFKIDSYFNKQGEPAKGLEEEFEEMKKLDIPLFKKFNNVTDFLNWVKKYFNKRGEDIFKRVIKMKYVHGKPLDPFEPKPYKPVYTGTYQPKTQTKTKKELPKEDDPWADFEEGEMMGDWKFSKERGWYHVGEENGGKNDDDYYDYYNY
jgi:hypothetical protein